MTTRGIRGRHYQTGALLDLTCTAGIIAAVEPANLSVSADLTSEWLAPALFDVQINGGLGVSFNAPDLTLDALRHVLMACRAHGIAHLLPTLVTTSRADTLAALHALTAARAAAPDVAAAIVGYHLEGPWISPLDGARGAHPAAQVRAPDWAEFAEYQSAAAGLIRLVTLAPEVPGALPFIAELTRAGVVVAIGHTLADAATIRQAVAAGARLSTHLGNGCPAMLHRHHNPLWPQLADERLWASLICDGHHVPADLARCVARLKPGQLILTCDASSLAGCPPGRYAGWGQPVEVLPNQKIVVADTPYLAGSAVFTDACIGIAVRATGLSWAACLDAASAAPRALLGLPPRHLAVGEPADVLLYRIENEELIVEHLVGG
jgi:N-acetylglucosamine-6-phosphate deacetylase